MSAIPHVIHNYIVVSILNSTVTTAPQIGLFQSGKEVSYSDRLAAQDDVV